MDPFSIPITPVTAPHIEVDPSLRTITQSDTIDTPVPKIRASTEERFNDFGLDNVIHVVIEQVGNHLGGIETRGLTRHSRITYSRQTQVFRSIGYQYDWNFPMPFWDYLGRIVAKGVFDDQLELENLNYSAVDRREFVAYTTSAWIAAVKARKRRARPTDHRSMSSR